MTTCNIAVSAQINGKEEPNRLYVHGSVLVYTSIDEIVVTEADPQGINPQILVLNVALGRATAPMKGTCRPFVFTKEVTGRQYDQVTVRFEHGPSSTVIVSFLG